jgi:hypothetical protein
MFINFSNHRLEKWNSEQLAEAKRFGEIVDLPFPNVNPNGDENYISSLADEYVYKIVSFMQDPAKDVVHIMGEFNLIYAVITKLKAQGIKCVAATSERNAEENVLENGGVKKEGVFKFCRFREY